MALQLVAIIRVKAGSERKVRDALLEIVEPSRHEPGCLSYEVCAARDDPATIVTIERWEAQADVDAHMQTDHIQRVGATLSEHLDGAPTLYTLEVLSD
jgi:quinol monooxygenase YgiN